MFWQLLVVGVIVLAALGYLVRSWWRTWQVSRGRGTCGGCGPVRPSEPAAFIHADQLRLKPPRPSV